jgi:hypothetical protein
MQKLRVGDQLVRSDRDATLAGYETVRQGCAERCGCVQCRNLAVQRQTLFPPAFQLFLSDLGVDWRKEAEASHCGPLEASTIAYSR